MTTAPTSPTPNVGDRIEPVALQTDPVRILRFGAVTHNAHLIHYDTAHAHSEGLAGRVVMAQLHGTLFFRAAARLAGDPGRVRSVTWQNRAPALVGCTLTVTGTVRDVAGGEVLLDLEERSDDGTLCAVGSAVLRTCAAGVTDVEPVC